jgi:hypothetical protein
VHTLALILMYSEPDPWLHNVSNDTLFSCTKQGNNGLRVVDVKSILLVIAMVPHHPVIPGKDVEERYFVVEKIGLEMVGIGGFRETAEEN